MSTSTRQFGSGSNATAGRPRLTVIGTGYLGATHAVCMAQLGFDVLAVDVDTTKIERLAAGEVPFFEPGLDELLQANLAAGRLRFTSSFEEVARFGDVHFLCVGTPQLPGRQNADLSYLHAAVTALAPHLRRGSLVVGKSTVPVGTAAALADRLAVEAPGVELAWNPEFLREGFAVEDTLRPDRLVFGVASAPAEAILRSVYAPITDQYDTPVIVADFATAELVKVAANSFLATKISYINAMAEVCEAVDADVTTLARALSLDERIGGKFLRPGVGFGGGCLPKDIRAFRARADELGIGHSLTFLSEVDEINLRRRDRIVQLARTAVGGSLAGQPVAVLGASFKPNSDDVRDSPALAVAALLDAAGATVTVYDPMALDNARRARPELTYATSAAEAVSGAKATVLLTEWAEFGELDPAELATLAAAHTIIDARHTLDSARWRAAGWTYVSPGRPAMTPAVPAQPDVEPLQRQVQEAFAARAA
ncbi:UDP-glucose/GDP-mannose dehydrogenase family protein [Frankia sp. AgB1.9]|uniref:UDP-glucose dehydrogenase family protein n=1 Tax=unclassified Frankia TaxID=2632575 RepID=UPI0019334129|nr:MULTISPECIES: UDP-glucose/GDP-mannose dehydrogenase family protein [unclassified Frankia]MBL7493764.1 UDP-glucose/GDP-mannose dehydrogenase family protein [Frankia sp. AgW1.1]MBL7547120.1 UDP-glucose/GDP-mannose dehydrogenase family protein [Frankia sp. AgB1.9]MBL7620058.1 UDP-glucose/GDP-mannose dehydrogenase family protein [Frankia sp. AgB1.8]